MLGAPLLEGVEEVSLLLILMEEEGELLALGVAALDHYRLSDSVCRAHFSTSEDFEDVVCTKVAVCPG